jgi:transcriptional regulator with XRE-family HTH domain
MSDKEIMKNFSDNMTLQMYYKRLSFRDLARLTGINPTSLNEYANAKREAPISNAIIIANAFGKTVEEMVKPREGHN